MYQLLQVITLVLVAIAMALALAHVAELPGKLRLDRATYLAVQPIYYPGFTIGAGIGEFGGMLALLVLLVATPRGTGPFWWTLAALASLVAMHSVYWVVTHPVNAAWMKGTPLVGFSGAFLSFGNRRRLADAAAPADWTKLRNAWEYSHAVRAGFALLGLVLLAIGATA
jgi:hypothetical protein